VRAGTESALDLASCPWSPAAEPKWCSRLAWVRPISAATAFKVTACGPWSMSSRRAAAKAADRLSSGLRRVRLIDISVSYSTFCDDDFRDPRSEEHTSELQSRSDLVCRLL